MDDTTEAGSRNSDDSLSSVSTTSIVFDRLHEQVEHNAYSEKSRHNGSSYKDIEDQDPLKDYDSSDVETKPFIGTGESVSQRQPMDKKFRRILVVVGTLFVLGWLGALGVFLASGSYKHASDTDHNPDADSRGSGKPINLDQIMSGYWSAKHETIKWIAGPNGEDGLLLEKGVPGKDFLVVEDVRSSTGSKTPGDGSTKIADTRTLMERSTFFYEGALLNPEWVEASPDLNKVLIGTKKERNWRHSFSAIYYVLDVISQEVEPLIPSDPYARVQLASWSPQSDAISFTMKNNMYIRQLSNKANVIQYTKDGGDEYFYGVPDWVYEEEVFGDRSVTWWSADGAYIAFLRTNETGVAEYPIEYFVSRPSGQSPADGEEAYPEVRQIKYPKAGSHNPTVDLLFYDVAKGDVFEVTIEGEFPNDDRIINNLLWAGGKLLVKETNRISDIMKVIQIDVSSRTGKTINTIDVNDIDGGWFEISHRMTYVPADEKLGRKDDGYVDTVIFEDNIHLAYFTPLDNPKPKMLTSGKWEVDDAPSAVDLNAGLVYFVGTKESSIQRHVYSVKLDGTDLKAVTDTSKEGYFNADFSTGAGFVVLSYRGPKIPYQKVMSTPSNKITYERILVDNAELADRAKKHELPILKYGQLDLSTGARVNYLERRPPHFDPRKKYPVLFQQYSGPGSQQVAKSFGVDFNSYVAAALGYIVITVDPRGTGFLGRKHRVVVRSHLGVLEAEDHIAAAKHFASQSYIDASRLAIWGWSYGGFQTLKTLEMDAGQTYSYGMAVAPVTDWRFYDSIYTERYMRKPQDNSDGYDATKISNATALGHAKRFLLMHGVADDNVHFQNSLTLLDDLDLAGVENYDVHVFPDSNHGIYFHSANRIVYDSKSMPSPVSIRDPVFLGRSLIAMSSTARSIANKLPTA